LESTINSRTIITKQQKKHSKDNAEWTSTKKEHCKRNNKKGYLTSWASMMARSVTFTLAHQIFTSESTNNLERRMRQHNGELAGDSLRTKR
jgi:hypothetical protein